MIQPKFRKDVNGQVFTELDFYQSRGIGKILACRLNATSKQIRAGEVKNKIKKFCRSLRKMRDNSFREQVVQSSGSKRKFKGAGVPKNKRLKPLAMVRDSVTFSMLVVLGVADECVFFRACFLKIVLIASNSELWVELTKTRLSIYVKCHCYLR